MIRDDARLEEAKAKPIADIAAQLHVSGLKRAGRELTGPCPECGGDDRFSINTAKGLYQCRKCGAKGDVIALVCWLRRCSLPEALTWLCGARQELSPAEIEERRRKDRLRREKADREEARRRSKAIAEARAIIAAGRPAEDSPVRDYLALRGLTRERLPTMPPDLGFHPDLPYMVHTADGWVEAHRGPAMLAIIRRPDGTDTAVHRTWFDLSRPRGKALILPPGGEEPLAVKKVWGSKKGAAIRLFTPAEPWDTLVMGEGIETTLTALVSGFYPGAAHWAGIDLGNIAGRMQQGKGLRYAGLPDLTDTEAFVPPPWVRELVLIEDGDSEPKMTRAKLQSGARRAMNKVPGLIGRVTSPPPGLDLNDVLMEGGE